MFFLLSQILLCLLAAFLVGLVLGSWLRNLSAKSRHDELNAEWRGRLRKSELSLADSMEGYTSLEAQYALASGELDTARSREHTLTSEISELKTNVSTIGTKLSEKDFTISDLQGDYASASTRIEVLERELAEATERATNTRRQLDAAASKVSTIGSELASTREKNVTLQKALDASASRVQSAESDLEQIAAHSAAASNDLANTRAQIEANFRSYSQAKLEQDKRLAEATAAVNDRENRLAKLTAGVNERDQEIARLRRGLDEKSNLFANLQLESKSTDEMLASLEEQLQVRDEDLSALRSELASSERAVASLESASGQSRQRVVELDKIVKAKVEELAVLRQEENNRSTKLEALHAQYGELLGENEQLAATVSMLTANKELIEQELVEREERARAADRRVTDHDGLLDKLRHELDQKSTRLSTIELEHRACDMRITNLEGDVMQRRKVALKLEEDLITARRRQAQYESTIHELNSRLAEFEGGSKKAAISVDHPGGNKKRSSKPAWVLSGPSKGSPDDLKEVKGIGPVLEKMLNKLGIYYFEQIAQFNESDVEWVTTQLDSFPDRVYRDKWMKQASKLHKKKYGVKV